MNTYVLTNTELIFSFWLSRILCNLWKSDTEVELVRTNSDYCRFI